MSCKYDYKGQKLTEKELIKALSLDPAIIAQYKPQEERPGSDYQKEDLAAFNKKVEHLKRSMNVEVFLDKNVKTSRLLASSDPRTVAAGKPVILINPNAIFKTTAIHEFAHVFVDSFIKGVDNPRLKKAYEELSNQPIYDEVKALYPDLNEEMFKKELIVTAIGRKGSEIWDNNQKASSWDTFKAWFLDYINRVLGLSKSQVESLAKEVLNTNPKTGLNDNLSDYVQQEAAPAKDEDMNAYELEIDIIHKEALARVSNMYEAYMPKNKLEKAKEYRAAKSGKTRFQKVSEIKESLDSYDKADKIKGLIKYVNWSKGEIGAIQKRLDSAKEEGELDADLIVRLDEWNTVFELMEDVKQLINSSEDSGVNLSENKKKLFNGRIQEIEALKNKVDSDLLTASRKLFARIMAKNDVESVELARKKYEAEWRDIGISEPMNEYVQRRMNENIEDIREKSYNKHLSRAVKSTSDIHKSVAILATEKNMKSTEIQIASKLIDKADASVKSFAIGESAKFIEAKKASDQELGGSVNLKDKYKNMLDITESGQYYFASEYKAEFLEQQNKMSAQASNSEIYSEVFKYVDISSDKNYTVDGVSKALVLKGTTGFEVEGAHITYGVKGTTEKFSISKEEAIAISELHYWKRENTKRIKKSNSWATIPTDKWKNLDYNNLTDAEKNSLKFLKGKTDFADGLTNGTNSLISHAASQKWIKLPSILKTDAERLSQGGIKDTFAHKINELYKVQKDEFDTTEGGKISDSVKVFADVSNKEKLRVPIPFRQKLQAKEQSLDLYTIVLANLVQSKNYREKKNLESSLLVITDVMANRYVPQTRGIRNLKKIHAFSKDTEVELHHSKSRIPNDASKMRDIIENRIYNIKNKDAGEIAGMNVQKLTSSWLKYSGSLSLIGNFANSIVNYNVGTSANLIEAVGGEHFGIKDLAIAKKLYWLDIKGIANDFTNSIDTSRTNMLLNFFVESNSDNVYTSNLEVDRARNLMKTTSLRPFAKGGEHMMQAQLMYAVLNKIKITNKKGQYLDNKGNVVKDIKDAASMHESIVFEKDEIGSFSMQFKSHVEATTFSPNATPLEALSEARSLVKKKIIDLHGNYDPEFQSAAQREWWGKLLFFLRKWIEPGFYRRWRGLDSMFKKHEDMKDADKAFSIDLKTNQEGYYVTATRFLTRTLPSAIKEMNFELLKKDKLEPHEAANLRKMLTEVGMIVLVYASYLALGGEDEDDENLYLRYLLRRHFSELTFFMLPTEAYKIASTPTASIGLAKRFLQLILQFTDPTEVYKAGPHKDKLKLGVKSLKSLPLFSQSLKDTRESLEFLTNMTN